MGDLAAINEREGSGYVSALVSKTSHDDFISRLRFRHNIVLAVAVVASIALLYLLFAILFRRPLRDIVSAMAKARAGNLSVRAPVRRDDELGAIASGFNRMIEDIRLRDEEREQLLSQVKNFNDELQNEVSRATKQLRASNEDLLTRNNVWRDRKGSPQSVRLPPPGARNRNAVECHLRPLETHCAQPPTGH